MGLQWIYLCMEVHDGHVDVYMRIFSLKEGEIHVTSKWSNDSFHQNQNKP